VPVVADALGAVRADVDRHYSDRLGRFGATPLGVGWTCLPTQELRFVQLAKLFDFGTGFSLNDVGCGYGALLAYLRRRHRKTPIDYLGLDLSQAMVDEGRRMWRSKAGVQFDVPAGPYRSADYCVASGIFNVKLGHGRDTWERFVAATIFEMYERCRRGVAVNFLARSKDLDEVPEHYRCEPQPWIDRAQSLGASVEVLAGYGMPEFTLLLRRQ
jgi:SAM-dependent methyltransferase